MPHKITLQPFVGDQLSIHVWGRRVGYCGNAPGYPVCFLTDKRNQCGLTRLERIEVLQHVRDTIGDIKPTPATKDLLEHVKEHETADDRTDTEH